MGVLYHSHTAGQPTPSERTTMALSFGITTFVHRCFQWLLPTAHYRDNRVMWQHRRCGNHSKDTGEGAEKGKRGGREGVGSSSALNWWQLTRWPQKKKSNQGSFVCVGGLSRAGEWGIKVRPSPLPTLIWKRPLLLSGLPMETILELSFSFFPEWNSVASSAKHLRIRTQILQDIVMQHTGVRTWQNLCPYPIQVNGNRNHLTPPHEGLAKELTRPPRPRRSPPEKKAHCQTSLLASWGAK